MLSTWTGFSSRVCILWRIWLIHSSHVILYGSYFNKSQSSSKSMLRLMSWMLLCILDGAAPIHLSVSDPLRGFGWNRCRRSRREEGGHNRKACFCYLCNVRPPLASDLSFLTSDIDPAAAGESGRSRVGEGRSLAWQTADEGWSQAEFMTPKWERKKAPPCLNPHTHTSLFSRGVSCSRHSWWSGIGRRSSRWGGMGLCVQAPLYLFVFSGEHFHMKNDSRIIEGL